MRNCDDREVTAVEERLWCGGGGGSDEFSEGLWLLCKIYSGYRYVMVVEDT